LDESVHQGLVLILRKFGYDAITTREAEQCGASDDRQLAYATLHGRVLVTYNTKDFTRLHRQYLSQSRSHCGIIASPQRPLKEVNRALQRLLAVASAEDLQNHLEHLSHWYK
jgi:predicted nuclease of predicted toxin-antitoxin system